MDRDRDFADAFEAAHAKLRAAVDSACAEADDWPRAVVLAVERVLELAAAHPDDVRALTIEAFGNGVYGALRYRRMVEGLATELGLGRQQSQVAAELPEMIEEALIGGIVEIVAERVRFGRERTLPDLTGELSELVLTPYLGAREARRLASEWPPT